MRLIKNLVESTEDSGRGVQININSVKQNVVIAQEYFLRRSYKKMDESYPNR